VRCIIFWKEEERERIEIYDGTGYGMKRGKEEGGMWYRRYGLSRLLIMKKKT